IFAVGRMVQMAMQAGIELMGKGISAGIVDARFVKPMDAEMLVKLAAKVKLVVTVEENSVEGGFGEGVLRLLQEHCIRVDALTLGVPDRFIDHGSVSLQLAECGLNGYGISQSILKRWMEREA
ncbi:MAG: transketolase C-terminal domain-containing protein, partial [Christensenellales bacterium]|nr:transketolase C-terminal domain-containing protein [Christensenellales bacterium]